MQIGVRDPPYWAQCCMMVFPSIKNLWESLGPSNTEGLFVTVRSAIGGLFQCFSSKRTPMRILRWRQEQWSHRWHAASSRKAKQLADKLPTRTDAVESSGSSHWVSTETIITRRLLLMISLTPHRVWSLTDEAVNAVSDLLHTCVTDCSTFIHISNVRGRML